MAESLRIAHASGALRSKDLKRVTVDTTVQPKNISFPTDAKLLHAAIRGLNRLANKHGVPLRQSYLRVAKRAAMMAGHTSVAAISKVVPETPPMPSSPPSATTSDASSPG